MEACERFQIETCKIVQGIPVLHTQATNSKVVMLRNDKNNAQ